MVRTLLRVTLSLLLAALAPGLGAYEAAAAAQRGGSGIPTVPTIPAGLSAVNGLPSAAHNPVPGALGGVGQHVVPSIPGLQPIPALGPAFVPAHKVDLAPNGAVAPVGGMAARALHAGVAELAQAKSESGRREALDRVFLGQALGGMEPVAAFVAGQAPSTGRTQLAPSQTAESQPLSLDELKGVAGDKARGKDERLSAVKAIKDLSSDPAKLALEEIGAYDQDAGAVDYEIKRAALAALAEQGKLLSLPAIGEPHRAEILKTLREKKPEAAAIDYDGTLEKSGEKASPETGAALKAVADAGVETMVLTGRSDQHGNPVGEGTILESFASLTPAQRASFSIGADRGARVLLHDQDGKARLIHAEPGWTENERTMLRMAATDVAWNSRGLERYEGDTTKITDRYFTLFLKKDSTSAEIAAAGERMRQNLAKFGLSYRVEARSVFMQDIPRPNIVIAKTEKSAGVRFLRENAGGFPRLRDAWRLLPSWLSGIAGRLLAALPKRAVPSKSTALIADHFWGEHTIDIPMLDGAPGATAISVGLKADPQLPGVVVWPTKGAVATREILAAIAAPAPAGEKLNMKAVTGLFTQRTASIVPFILTTLAYPFVAIPIVGVAQFGALLALGSLASIALGPVNAMIVKKLSARNAMAVNGLMRGVLAMALPVFGWLGLLTPGAPLAFAALAFAAVANGWLLSSVLTTEGIFVKRLAGKHIGTINGLAWINFLMIQAVLGAIVKVGGMVGSWDLMVPYYISAAVHAFFVVPVIWATIPNTKADDAAAMPKLTGARLANGGAAFLRKYWKEAAVASLGIAGFILSGSTIPAALGIIYWVTKTPNFKQLWQNKTARAALLLSGLAAFLYYPLQGFVFPQMAESLAGAAGKIDMLGQMLGALFFGQLVSTVAQTKMPRLRAPLIGRFGAERLIQAVTMGLLGAWFYATMFPGSLALAALGVVAGLLSGWLAAKVSDTGWLKFAGIGLGAIGLTALFWGNLPVMFLSIFAFGMVYGPNTVALGTIFYKNIPEGKSEEYIGIQGSVFNAAITLGFGVVTLMASFMKPVIPSLLWPMTALSVAIGVLYFFVPQFLPGLPKNPLKDKEN